MIEYVIDYCKRLEWFNDLDYNVWKSLIEDTLATLTVQENNMDTDVQVSQFRAECMRYMFGDNSIDPNALAHTIKESLESEEFDKLEEMGDGFLEAVTDIYVDSIDDGDDEVIKQLVSALNECRS